MGKGLAHSMCSGIEDSSRLWNFIALWAILSSYVACISRTQFHSAVVSTSALHAEGPGFMLQWSHSPWSTAMPP